MNDPGGFHTGINFMKCWRVKTFLMKIIFWTSLLTLQKNRSLNYLQKLRIMYLSTMLPIRYERSQSESIPKYHSKWTWWRITFYFKPTIRHKGYLCTWKPPTNEQQHKWNFNKTNPISDNKLLDVLKTQTKCALLATSLKAQSTHTDIKHENSQHSIPIEPTRASIR